MTARLFYYCGANAHPTGGNKVIYRHVDLLAKAGFDAWVYHPIDGFAYPGLVSHPRIVTPASIVARRCDLFVLPEDAGPGMASFAPGMRKLIFNQMLITASVILAWILRSCLRMAALMSLGSS